MSDEQAVEPEEAKGKKPKKQKKPKQAGAAAPAASDNVVAVNRHPRAAAAIPRLRSRAALVGFAFVAVACYRAGVPLDDTILRGLTAGVVAYFVGWYVGVTVWKQLIRAELRIALARRGGAAPNGDA